MACRNFVQLCLEGYYDGTTFHRVIKGMMVQGGDPTGTGTGGESAWGHDFKDEVHSRIRFNHRGQFAMANRNVPNSNSSQFFFTLDKAEHLQGKHTIFGKITGNTIFNALRMGNVDVDEHDRPVEAIQIESMEVLNNPFDDVVPRSTVMGRKKEEEEAAKREEEARHQKRKRQSKKKDFKLLSFGEEAEEEELTVSSLGGAGIKSAHDALADEKLSKQKSYNLPVDGEGQNTGAAAKGQNGATKRQRKVQERAASPLHEVGVDDEKEEEKEDAVGSDGEEFLRKMQDSVRKKQEEAASTLEQLKGEADGEKLRQRKALIKAKAEEYESLREELKVKHRATRVMTGSERAKHDAEQAHREMLTPLEQMRLKYKQHKKRGGDREADTLAKLESFKSKVRTIKKEARGTQSKEAPVYNGQVLESGALYEGDDSADEGQWMSDQLRFKKHIDDAYRSGADGRDQADYVVIDPKQQKMR